MTSTRTTAIHLHKNVPPDWYSRSIRENIFQRFWHKTRFREVGKLITPAQFVLDIGCADGTFTKIILDKTGARKIIGIDALKNSVLYAKKRFAKNIRAKKMMFRIADAHKLPFDTALFNAVFCLETLEHVVDPTKVLKEIERVLKKGGYTVILVPAENLLFKIIWWVWQRVPGKNVWEHTHLHNFSNGFLENLLIACGFKLVENRKFLLNMLHLVKAVKTG